MKPCFVQEFPPPGKAFDDECASMQSYTRTLDGAAHRDLGVCKRE